MMTEINCVHSVGHTKRVWSRWADIGVISVMVIVCVMSCVDLCVCEPYIKSYNHQSKQGMLCRSIPVTVPEIKYKTEKRTQTYPCQETQQQQQCHSVPRKQMSQCPVTRTEMQSYDCSQTHIEERCHEIPVQQTKTCTRTVPSKQHTCHQTVNEQVCKTVEETIQQTCEETVHRQQDVDCSEVVMERSCQKVSDQIDHTCQRTSYKSESYDCSTSTTETQCTPGRQVPKVCYRDQMKIESYSCPETIQEEKCVQVPTTKASTCQRTVPSKKKYECGDFERKEQCDSPSKWAHHKPSTIARKLYPSKKGHQQPRCRSVLVPVKKQCEMVRLTFCPQH
eukprot:GHVQ01025744.1.p1 GENE.GHVQ01025744.1~~GHVQ01025744.1.p1  ORF type:complete len:336 (-),score=45.70 GHVQ01025744.1:3370-4377(-)